MGWSASDERYRTEFAGLRLLVQPRKDGFEYIIFEGGAIIWWGTAGDIQAAKTAALFEAREWSLNSSDSVPVWEACSDES